MGAGNKEFRQANVLRAMLLECEEEETSLSSIEKSAMWVMESNLDDCTGEALGLVMESLLNSGAADVWYTPIFMKKNRPAYKLSVLCREEDREALENLIFTHTTTIGIRRMPVERTVLERRMETVDTCYGQAQVKICIHNGHEFYYPEYESVKKLCTESGCDYQSVYAEVVRAARACK